MNKLKFRIWTGEYFMYSGSTPSMLSGFFNDTAFYNTYLNFPYEQFTGLHDKNGKEIYEGDIVNGEELNYRVIFMYGSFEINDPNCCSECKEGRGSHGGLNEYLATSEIVITVIGNIHENPELLEKNK